MTTKRLKRLLINPDVFFAIMQNKSAWRVFKGIPITAQLRGFTLDPITQNLNLFIEDESFDLIDIESTVAPILVTEFHKIT